MKLPPAPLLQRTCAMAGPISTTSSRRPNILRCIIITVIALLVLIALIVLIIWLVIRPAPITYTIETARISDYNLTDSSSNNKLNATFDITIQTTNHNKKISVYYDYIESSVWYGDQMVAVKELSPFRQGKRNVTTMEVRLEAKEVALAGSTARSLKRERTAGVSSWEVRVGATVRFKVGSIKSRHYGMKVECSPLVVHFPSGKSKDRVYCDVDV